MFRRLIALAVVSILVGGFCACTKEKGGGLDVATYISERLGVYAVVDMEVPWDLLDERDRSALREGLCAFRQVGPELAVEREMKQQIGLVR